ncbi:MAG: hypothetical protein ACK4GL_04295 [Flavobacteriales bacterium]
MESLPLKFILHGSVMTLWYILLVVQSALINVRKVQLHMRLGWLLAGLALFVVISAWPVMMGFAPRVLSLGFIDLEKPSTLVHQAWMWYNDLMALFAFTIMVSIAIWKRKKVALHRSMVLIASMMFMASAIARMLEWMTNGFSFISFIITSLAIMFAYPIALVVIIGFATRCFHTILLSDWVLWLLQLP